MYVYIYIYTHTYIHTYMHTYMHACIHACMHAYMHTYIHTCMHACIHTYILVCFAERLPQTLSDARGSTRRWVRADRVVARTKKQGAFERTKGRNASTWRAQPRLTEEGAATRPCIHTCIHTYIYIYIYIYIYTYVHKPNST